MNAMKSPWVAGLALVSVAAGLAGVAQADRPWLRFERTATVEPESKRVFGWSFREGDVGTVAVVASDGSPLEVRVYDGRRLLVKESGPACHLAVEFVATSSAVHTIEVHNPGSDVAVFSIEIATRDGTETVALR